MPEQPITPVTEFDPEDEYRPEPEPEPLPPSWMDGIVRAVALGADFLVVHPGARGESKTEHAVSTIVESVKQASKRVPMGNLRILIENTAGMGSAVGARLEEVGEILAGLRDVPAGACLDTAHLFAAGYDIRSEGGLASTIGQI